MIHVAVLLKPYLDLILERKKTVECRLTRQARDPYERIDPGERIYFKVSAGPYAATALADHVLFEDNLTPKRVDQIRRDYNDLIRGQRAFWTWKRNSRFCSLIWLKDVQPIDSGPHLRPLQGVAWLSLDEEPAWRRVACRDDRLVSPAASFQVEVTSGNLRNNSVYVTKIIDRFPSWSMGGHNRTHAARNFTLMLHNGPTVQTDIVGSRHLIRARCWGRWFRKHGVQPGDCVVFTPISEGKFMVGLARNGRLKTEGA